MRLLGRLKSVYLGADERSLAAGRIALAVVLLLDLARRAREIDTLYSNDGLLPNHTVLWRPSSSHVFSFFFMASHGYEAALGFALCALVYAGLLFGHKTQFCQVASLLCVLSLHGRTQFAQNGGDNVLGELCLFAAFLPLGRRYALDAREQAAGQRDVRSLAMLALRLQIATIYAFNALQKTGPTWRDGSVVHYMLHQDGIVTMLGAWLRDRLTLGESAVMTHAAHAIEAALPLLILSPVAVPHARRLAAALMLALHGGFALALNLGIFSFAMLAFAPFLLPGEDIERFVGWLDRTSKRHLGDTRRRLVAWRDRLPQVTSRGRPARTEPHRRRALVRLGEVTIVVIMGVAGCQELVDNPVTGVDLSWRPRAVGVAVDYLQMLEAWAMYAPDAPTTDTNLWVNAVTRDGRHVDPFNERASPGAPRPGGAIPAHLGQSCLLYAYALRIPYQPAYHRALGEWILRYPERTGHAGDEIRSFSVYAVEDESPPPGEREPRRAKARFLFGYP